MTQFEPRPFGKYFLTDRIAVGGMAEIYKAKTFGVDGFEKTLAIKKILPNFSADKDFVTMLTDEAKLVVNLSHPNIVQIYDLGRVADDYFISMEFIDGINLRELINRGQERNEPLPLDVCLYLASEICKGLDYAHSKRGPDGQPLGIVHRDVSPHNILVTFEGEVKIVDFGIAKAAMNVSQTQLGTLKGKVTYMSPEQAVGKPIDHHTDIFSCGIVLYEMLTFQRLFHGETQLEVLNIIRNTPMTEDNLRGKVPDPILKILAKALAYNTKDRYVSAADMQVELTRLLYSKFPDFNPRKLSEILSRWYGALASAKNEPPLALHYQTEIAFATGTQEQVNLVHRDSSSGPTALDDLGGQTLRQQYRANDLSLSTGQNDDLSASRSRSFVLKDESTERQRFRSYWRRSPFRTLSLIGLLFATLLGSGYFFFQSTKTDTPRHHDQEQIPTIQFGNVALVTMPPNAKVILDDRDTGLVTPATLEELKAGRDYKITLTQEGYQALTTTIRVEAGQVLPLQFSLEEVKAPTYALTIRTVPQGARVTINDEPQSQLTPLEIPRLQVGQEYRVSLNLNDYEEYTAIVANDVAKDQIINVNLVKVPTASLQIVSDPIGASIILGGKDSGLKTPHQIDALSVPQTLELKLHKDGYEDVTQTLELARAQEKSIVVKLSPVVLPETPAKTEKPISKETKEGDAESKKIEKVKIEKGAVEKKSTTKAEAQTTELKTRETRASSASSAATAKLRIDSNPRGASVTIDGSAHGITPIVLSNLPKQKALRVQISKKGYKTWQGTVNLSKDYTETTVTLTN